MIRWGCELLAHNLQTVFNCRFQRERYLLRSLQQEVQGSSRISIAASIRVPWSRPSPPRYRRRGRCRTRATSRIPGSPFRRSCPRCTNRFRERSSRTGWRWRTPTSGMARCWSVRISSRLVYEPGDHAGGNAAGASGQTLGRIDELFRADI